MKVNIIGAGLAGLSAAITLARQNISSCLISPQPSERAQSVLAEGGINAALDTMGELDTPQDHFEDTMRGGVYLANPDAVRGLVEAAPSIVRELHALGVPFQMQNGHILLRPFGGQKKKRTAYSKSSTGKMLMSAFIDECRKYEPLIQRMPHHSLTHLEISDGSCHGCMIQNKYTKENLFLPGAVILASGGINGLFGAHTTGTTQNTGAVTAMAFMQGVYLANLEFIQYHPTTVAIPGKRMLISEAARGEGGRLFTYRNQEKWYFMEEKYPELGNLMPRDVVSREIAEILRHSDQDNHSDKKVYLDMTGLDVNVWKQKLSDLRDECRHFLNLDPAKVPIPIEPGIHYFMGGIQVDINHRTNISHLYAAGECACQYHGANRLGGNSMLGAIYGGRQAAQCAADELIEDKYNSVQNIILQDSPPNSRLTELLMTGLNIVRDEETLKQTVQNLDALLLEEEKNTNSLEMAKIILGKAIVLSALERKESRGAHFRRDFPLPDETYHKTSVASYQDGKISIILQNIE